MTSRVVGVYAGARLTDAPSLQGQHHKLAIDAPCQQQEVSVLFDIASWQQQEHDDLAAYVSVPA
jgi:hypothetical protein